MDGVRTMESVYGFLHATFYRTKSLARSCHQPSDCHVLKGQHLCSEIAILVAAAHLVQAVLKDGELAFQPRILCTGIGQLAPQHVELCGQLCWCYVAGAALHMIQHLVMAFSDQ